jgi:signal peptidase II
LERIFHGEFDGRRRKRVLVKIIGEYMETFKKAALIVLVLCSCVGCDQATKAVAREHLASPQPVYFVGDMVVLQYSENAGAFLGLGSRLPASVRFWLLIVSVAVVLAGMLAFVWTSKEMNSLGVAGGSLVIGGGFSNLIDRIANGGLVSDFMNLGVGSLRTGIFNVADLAIVVGVGILLVSGMALGKGKGST